MSKLSELVQEKIRFLNTFIQSPKDIGSITPSTKYLAAAMVKGIAWDTVEHAAELGAGTGAITSRLREAAGDKARVLLFEKDPQLRERLLVKYPGFPCYADASQIRNAMTAEGIPYLDVIISGLPFFNFSQPIRDRIMEEIQESLRPGGYFVAFQYSLQMKRQLSRQFDIEAIQFVPYNLPPAFVYLCRKKS